MAQCKRKLGLIGFSAQGSAGFSLLEILVAIAVAGVGFLGLAALQANTMRNITVSRRAAVATSLATDRLEVARRGRFADVGSVAPQTVVVDGYSFTVSQTATSLGSGNAKEVTVTVVWQDQFGSHSLVSSSTVSR